MEIVMSRTKTQWSKFEAALLAKQTELTGRSSKREDILVEHSADEMDDALRAADRELAIAQLNRASETLRSVREALERIEDGSYGFCLGCDQEISRKRLEAVPWAPLCIRCQEARDRNDDASDDFEVTPARRASAVIAEAA